MIGTTREPTPDHVDQILTKIALLGGEDAGVCRGRIVVFHLGNKPRSVHTCCCGGQTRARLPVPGSGTPATVCIVCDAVTEFPRLAE